MKEGTKVKIIDEAVKDSELPSNEGTFVRSYPYDDGINEPYHFTVVKIKGKEYTVNTHEVTKI